MSPQQQAAVKQLHFSTSASLLLLIFLRKIENLTHTEISMQRKHFLSPPRFLFGLILFAFFFFWLKFNLI